MVCICYSVPCLHSGRQQYVAFISFKQATAVVRRFFIRFNRMKRQECVSVCCACSSELSISGALLLPLNLIVLFICNSMHIRDSSSVQQRVSLGRFLPSGNDPLVHVFGITYHGILNIVHKSPSFCICIWNSIKKNPRGFQIKYESSGAFVLQN